MLPFNSLCMYVRTICILIFIKEVINFVNIFSLLLISVERDLKELEVHKVQRELEIGMEKWQDRILLLQWLDVNRAKEQASRELEIKVERLQQKNRAKTIIHTMNINK